MVDHILEESALFYLGWNLELYVKCHKLNLELFRQII